MFYRYRRNEFENVDCFPQLFSLCVFVVIPLCFAASPTCRSVNYILDSLPQLCPTSLHFPSEAITTTSATSPLIASSVTNFTSSTAGAYSSLNESIDHTPVSDTASIETSSSSPTEVNFPQDELAAHEGIEKETPTPDEGFLSFEDWKRLNLLRSSDSGDEPSGEQPVRPARQAPQPRGQSSDQAVDSLGDEFDIQLETSSHGKTYKERFNYASFDCAAAVLKSNPEGKGASAILDENRDRYMLNKCGASSKFVIVEMCEDILVDTVVLANFEFFSSTFKEFRVSASDRYPVHERGWKTLGTFLASNTREMQVFAIENPLIWARYVRIDFLSHYGTEFYCPLTLLRIHGTTMMEEYKNQEINKQDEYRQERVSEPVAQFDHPNGSIGLQDGKSVENETASSAESAFSPSSAEHKSIESISLAASEDTDSISNTSIVSPIRSSSVVPASEEVPSAMTASADMSISSIQTDTSTSTAVLSSVESPGLLPNETQSESVNNTTISAEKPEMSAGAAASIGPGTQESVYKQITKRLSLLEANATLSLRYIEEQSQLLRDVFSRMEKRHSQKIDSFLTELNSTLVARLQYFRQQYEELWQSTIVELESQRDASRAEIVAISTRLSLLADELIFQKRMSIAHSIMLLVTLLFVLTTRGVSLDYRIVARNVPRTDLSSPFSSPSSKFVNAGTFTVRERGRREGTPDSKAEFGKLSPNFRSLSNLRESVHSAPVTPSGSFRGWNTPSSSSLHRYLSPSDDEDMLRSDSDTSQMPARMKFMEE